MSSIFPFVDNFKYLPLPTDLQHIIMTDINLLRRRFQENQYTANSADEGKSIIIVGAGAFGSSLALELVKNYRDVYYLWKSLHLKQIRLYYSLRQMACPVS